MDNSTGVETTHSFSVYGAQTPDTNLFQWNLVRTLRGCALFLGRYGYKFMSVLIGDGHYVAQEDCIYFLYERFLYSYWNSTKSYVMTKG